MYVGYSLLARPPEPSFDEVWRTFGGAGVNDEGVCFEGLPARRR